MTSDQEAALIRAAQAGETGARDQLVEQWLPAIQRIARRRNTRYSGLEYEDLVQVGVMGFMSTLRTYRQGPVRLWPYAMRRVHGAMSDAVRAEICLQRGHVKNKKRRPLQFIEEYDIEDRRRSSHIEEADARHDSEALLRVLASNRQYIVRRLHEGASQKEISVEIGVPHTRVGQILWPAMRRLRVAAEHRGLCDYQSKD